MRGDREVHGFRRVLRWVVRGLVTLVVGVVVLFVGILIALRFDAVQRQVATRTNTALENLFKGRVVIERLGRVDLSGISGLNARVLDPQGRPVLVVQGLTVRIFWLATAYQAVVKRPEVLPIRFDGVSLDEAVVTIIDDGTGSPTLAKAFEPKEPTPPEPEKAGGTELTIPHIRARHIWIHGGLASVPVIDAELSKLDVQLAMTPKQIEVGATLERLVTRALPQRVDPSGRLEVSARLPTDEKAPKVAKAEFRGTIAGTEAALDAALDGEQVNASFVAPNIQPATLSTRVAALDPKSPLALDLKVKGTLSDIGFDVRLDGKAAKVRLGGTAAIGDRTTVDAKLTTRGVQLEQLLRDGPETRVDLDATANVAIEADGRIAGKYRLTTPGGAVAAQAVPALALDGTLARSSAGGMRANGVLEIKEPGAPTRLTYDANDLGEPDAVIDAELTSRIERPARLAKLAPGTQLSGTLAAKVRFRPESQRLNAEAKGEFRDVQAAQARVGSLNFDVRAQGPAANPELALKVRARTIAVAERSFSQADVSVVGNQKNLQIDADIRGEQPDRVRVRTTLAVGDVIALGSPRAEIRDGEGAVELRAQSVVVAPRRIQVERLELTGAGNVQASVVWTDRLSRLDFSTTRLDLVRLTRLFGVETPLEGGTVTLQGYYAPRPRGMSGALRGSVDSIRASALKNGQLGLDFVVDGRTVSGNMEAVLAEGARVRVIADRVVIPEAPFTAQRLEQLEGELDLAGTIDLRRLEPVLVAFAPLGSAAGTVKLAVNISHPRGQRLSRLRAEVQTQGLRLAGQRETKLPVETAEVARETQPWALRNLDFGMEVELDPSRKIAKLDAEVRDPEGRLLFARAEAEPDGSQGILALLKRLPTTPLQVRAEVPARRIDRLPAMIRPPELKGTLSLELLAKGTLQDPTVELHARVQKLASLEMKQGVDVALDGKYAKANGNLGLVASNGTRRVADITARWNGDAATLGQVKDMAKPSPVQADLRARLDRFPLGVIPALAERQVKGPMSGDLQLTGFGRDATVSGRFTTDTLLVGRVGIQKFEVGIDAKEGRLAAKADIGGNGGVLHAEMQTGMRWGDRVVPEIDPNIQARLQAKEFRMETFAPLVQGQVSELEGRLNADVRAELVNGKPLVDGSITLRRGVLQLPAIGQRFHEIEAAASIHRGKARLDKFRARGTSGRLSLTAAAELDGVLLRSAEAHLDINRGDKVPLTMEGSTLGDVWGNIDVHLRTSETEPQTRIDVNIPTFTLEMPEANPAALQDLEPASDIRAGVHLEDGSFATVPIQPLEQEEEAVPSNEPPSITHVQVKLGNGVWVRRGQQVEAQLAGQLDIRSGAATQINGQIDLRDGFLDVQGKRFDIERGTVTFGGGDPANPTILAVARWESPLEYTIYVEYSGTAQEGKLTLRSEPALTENEIMSLLLFGSPDGTVGSGSGDSTSTAVGIAGGTATQGLNRALSNITALDVSARIDTSTGSARPELVIQVTPRITARITRALGEPTPGQTPDRTFLTLELRLRQAWSLSGLIGDRGASALDLIWRKRY